MGQATANLIKLVNNLHKCCHGEEDAQGSLLSSLV